MLLGIPPEWYKSRNYRSRMVREPRAVLAEFGLQISRERAHSGARLHRRHALHRAADASRRHRGLERGAACRARQPRLHDRRCSSEGPARLAPRLRSFHAQAPGRGPARRLRRVRRVRRQARPRGERVRAAARAARSSSASAVDARRGAGARRHCAALRSGPSRRAGDALEAAPILVQRVHEGEPRPKARTRAATSSCRSATSPSSRSTSRRSQRRPSSAPEEVAPRSRRRRIPRADDRLRARATPTWAGSTPKLAVPRRATPRAVVPAGSVAIANEQTVVYPVRDLGRLERHRAHAADACSTRAREAPSLLRRRRPGALPRHQPRTSSWRFENHEHPRPAAGLAHHACRTTAATASSTSACARAARWTRSRSRSPTRWSATRRRGGARDHGDRPRAAVRGGHAGRGVRRRVQGRLSAQPAGARARRHALQRRPRGARRARLPRGGGRLRRRAGARQPQHLPAGTLRRLRGQGAQARRRADAARRRAPSGALRQAEEDARRHGASGRRRRSRCPTASRSWCTCIEGQHFASFDSNAQRAFFDTVWKIAPDSNRMGFRLARAAARRGEQADEILSGPTCLGTVQVPPNGMPIALMADHQTTGGYPSIAEIASADVPRLAQLAPGGTVHFARCDLEMAARAAPPRQGAARRGAARHRVELRGVRL